MWERVAGDAVSPVGCGTIPFSGAPVALPYIWCSFEQIRGSDVPFHRVEQRTAEIRTGALRFDL